MTQLRLGRRLQLLTGGFALTLAAITFGLTWQARAMQQRWTKLIETESAAVARLDDFIRSQNAFRSQLTRTDVIAAPTYATVTQLLDAEPLHDVDTGALHVRVRSYEQMLRSGVSPSDLDMESARIVTEADRLKREHQAEIARQLDSLRFESRNMMLTGFSVAWIVVILGIVATKDIGKKVVKPVEGLRIAANRIAAGDLDVKAPVAGDGELIELANAFNTMAKKVQDSARTDDLTELPNFRSFREQIKAGIDRANRYSEKFGVLVLDLDRFKKYNDTYGHQAGNDALHRVADAIRASVRAVDFAARYGGEEFAVLAPQVDAEALAGVAERIRAAIEAIPASPDGAQVTVSIGAAIYPSDGLSEQELFRAADERLYQAKREGRNRVIVRSAPAVQSAG